jgi:hypothetical protein
MLLGVDVGENRPRVRIVGIKLDGALQAGAHQGVLPGLNRPLMIVIAKDAIVGCKRRWRLALRLGLTRFRDHAVAAGNDRRDLLRDIFLNLKQIGCGELLAVGLGPDDAARLRINQTGRESDLVPVASNAAGQQIVDAELLSEALRIG